VTTKEQALQTRIDEFIGYDAPRALREIGHLFDNWCPLAAIAELEELARYAQEIAKDCEELQKLQLE